MNLQEIDSIILGYMNQPYLQQVNFLFIWVIFSIYAFLIFLAYYFFKKKEKSKLIHLIVASIIGYAIVSAIKYIVARERPYEIFQNIILSRADYSFPSSHTFISFLCLYFIPKDFSKWSKILILVYLVLLIPLGSIYMGVHYPSDVLFGAFLGVVMPRLISEKISYSVFNIFFKKISQFLQ